MQTLGLALIAKNEAERLPKLLASIEGAFDRIALVDTGSRDRTVRVFRQWAATQEGLEIEVDHMKWTKDFGEARRRAQALLKTDWEVWADCDDIINGAQNLRQVAANAPDQVAAYVFGYNYAQHPSTGACICYLQRERLVRRGLAQWINRVHEAQTVQGMVVKVGPEVAEWVHQKQHSSVEQMKLEDSRRNLDILDNWVKDEPTNTRVLAYLGTEHLARGEVDVAQKWLKQYFDHNPEWDEERAQVHRKLALTYLMQEKWDAAIETALAALKVMPQWTDSYVSLAEGFHMKGEHRKAIEWANEALRRGQPETLLIINPFDYTFQPRKILAGAHAGLGDFEKAVEFGEQAWQLNPADELLSQALNHWRAAAKRERTANTVAMLAQLLVAHDEQLKALTFLTECVPFFVDDHQGVVNLRSELRQRLDWIHNPESLLEHYENGGSKPEDFLPDDKLDEVPARLPRTLFLYKGLHDQMIEQHIDGLLDEATPEIHPFLEVLGDAVAPQAVS